MAKVNGPLLSLEAKGSFAKTLIFKRQPHANHVTIWNEPKKNKRAPSAKQLFQRNYFQRIVIIWYAQAGALRDEWNERATGQNLTGFNLYTSTYTLQRPAQVGNARLGHMNVGVLTN